MGSSDESEDYKDPALKRFNRTTFMAKKVVKDTVVGGGVGALVGAAIGAALVLALSVFTVAATGPFGAVLGFLGVASGTAGALIGPAIITAATTGAMWGAGVGAAGKGLMSISSSSEAADDEEQRLKTKFQQVQVSRQRMEAFERQRDMQQMAFQQQTMGMRGMNRNQGLPPMSGPGHAHMV